MSSVLCSGHMHHQCTWEPADESCPQHQARYSGPELLQQFESVVLRGPIHAQQCEVADMLQRNVNVLAHLQRRMHSASVPHTRQQPRLHALKIMLDSISFMCIGSQ